MIPLKKLEITDKHKPTPTANQYEIGATLVKIELTTQFHKSQIIRPEKKADAAKIARMRKTVTRQLNQFLSFFILIKFLSKQI